MIRILLVDDQNIVRQGIQALLEPKQQLQVVGTAQDGDSAIKQVENLKPDVVLMDIEMPQMNGLTAIEKITQQFPETKVLVLSSHEEPQYIEQALQAGAEGYLPKNTLAEDLEKAIWSVYRGHTLTEKQLLSETKKSPDRERKYNKEWKEQLKIFSQLKNRWIITLGLLGLLIAIATIIYSLNFANRKTTPAPTEESVEPVVEGITALGKLEPEGKVITLSPPPNLGGSKIDELMIEEGERVKKGQVIALLNNHALKKVALEVAQRELEVAEVNLAIVKAGAKTGEIEAQKAIVKKLEAELAGKNKTQGAIVARLQAQLRRETQVQSATLERWQAELTNATAEFQRYQQLAENKAISVSELDSRRLTLETAQQRVREAQATYNRTRDTLQEEIKEAQSTAEETQNTIAQQIKEAQSSLASIAEVRPLDVQKAEIELGRAIAKLKEAKQDLELTYVKAPISSQILRINAYPGEMVKQDEGVVELGKTAHMVVIAEIYESDISGVSLGQQATIVSEGGAFAEEIQGKVTHIRPQISKQEVLDTDPAADVDTRIVEVTIRLNPEDSQRVAGLTNSKVIVKILP
jgi:HlyD family secretion protein